MKTTRFKLKDILKIKNGCDHSHLEIGDYPVIGSGGIMRYADQYLYKGESVLLPRKGTLDNIQYINGAFWTVDTCYYTDINKNIVNPYYLYRHLRSLDLSGLDSGASIPSMTSKCYYNIKIDLPCLQIQNQIADILSAYDDLIENNNRRIALLEKAAQELYKEWFVRFRFPGYENAKFENGLPEGWKIAKLGTLCKVITGKKDANEATGQGIYPFFTCARETTLFTDEYILDTNAILISGNGSYTGLVKKHSGKFDLYQRTYALYDFQNIEWLYLYWTMKIDFEREFMGGSRGSAIPYITRPNIEKFKIIVPPRDIMKKAQQTFEQIHNECLYLERQNKNLVKQRDLLLPRLMSGKLEV